MSILQGLESIKYRFVSDLIKNDEQYDKKKGVVTGMDAFKMCHGRYLLMQQILKPLKMKLGDAIDVTDISFVDGMQEDRRIIVKYIKEGRQFVLAVSDAGFGDVSVIASDISVQGDSFVKANKGMILRTFKRISDESLYENITVKSTTGRFIIQDNCDSFTIRDNDNKVFSIEGKYSSYEKNGSLSDTSKLVCNYPKLKELLLDDNNILALYSHLHIYENDFPKSLIKKIN